VADEARKKVSVKIYEATRDSLEKEKMKLPSSRRPDYADMLEPAVTRWLNRENAADRGTDLASPYEAANVPLHEKLEEVLNSGDEGVIAAVVPNIEIFHDRLRPKRSRGGAVSPAKVYALSQEEARLVEEFRVSSFDKRRRMLGFAAKAEDLEPELMPSEKQSGRRKSV
jgi:hypothetical protein